MKKLISSPFFIFDFSNDAIRASNLVTNERIKSLHPEITRLYHFCLEEKTWEQCLDEGLDEKVLEFALKQNIIFFTNNPTYQSIKLWEDRNWLRAAYLTFSQINLKYKEEVTSTTTQKSLINLRKEIIESYKDLSRYPTLKFRDGERIPLLSPKSSKRQVLDPLITRRSIRNYANCTVSFEKFSSVLFEASDQLREGEVEKNNIDPVEIFNSYFCWANLYIIVQAVEGIERGIYQYDFPNHSLVRTGNYSENAEVYNCIQNQKWIGGAGFCIFVCAQWDRYYWVYRHSRAYINLLIQVGELGQEFFQAAVRYGLGGWGTPAITESNAAKLLGIDSSIEDAIYFLKIGLNVDAKSDAA